MSHRICLIFATTSLLLTIPAISQNPSALDSEDGAPADVVRVDADGDVHITGRDNNGTVAAFRIVSGNQELLLDGNEIDSISDLFVNLNATSNLNLVKGGGNVSIGGDSPQSRLVVTSNNFKGASKWTMTVDSATSDSTTAILNLRNSGASSVLLARSDGRLGFGTENPETILHAKSSGGQDASLLLETASGLGKWRLTNQNASGSFFFHDVGRGDRLVIDSAGNIGIGTPPAAASKLKVNGTIETAQGGIRFPDGSVQSTAALSGVESLNGLGQQVIIEAGSSNVSVTTDNNSSIIISVAEPSLNAGEILLTAPDYEVDIDTGLGRRPRIFELTIDFFGMNRFSQAKWIDIDRDGSGISSVLHTDHLRETKTWLTND